MAELRRLNLSATEIKLLTGWPDSMVEDYLNILQNFLDIQAEIDINGATLSALTVRVDQNEVDISGNAADISTNTSDISNNASNIAANTDSINDLGAVTSTQFQAIKNSTQATTGTFAVVTGFSVDKNIGGFTFDSGLGEVTFTVDGEYEISCLVVAPTDLELQAQLDPLGGGAFADIAACFDANSSSVQINSYQLSIDASDKVRFMVRDTASTANIVADRALITIRRIS